MPDYSKTRIDGAFIDKKRAKEEMKIVWHPYGLPDIMNLEASRYAPGLPIQPKWEISNKIAISVALTGAFFNKTMNPNQPITPEEIIAAGRDCLEAGAPTVHIHVRNERGFNVLDPTIFHKVIDPLKEQFKQAVFDGCLVPALEGEWNGFLQMVEEKLLDVVPINTTAVYLGDSLFAIPPHIMIEKAKICEDRGIKPQIAIYTDGDIDNANRYLIRPGVISKPYYWIILPALPGCSPLSFGPKAMVEGLLHLVNRIHEVSSESVIIVCAAGRASSYLSTLAVLFGLNVRVGMEDTIWTHPHEDTKVASNVGVFEHTKAICDLLGRKVCTSAEYRKMIGI